MVQRNWRADGELMGKRGWRAGLLLISPLVFWAWTYTLSEPLWAENVASAPGVMGVFYSLLSCYFLFQRRWGWGILAMALGCGFLVRTVPGEGTLKSECADPVNVCQYHYIPKSPQDAVSARITMHRGPAALADD